MTPEHDKLILDFQVMGCPEDLFQNKAGDGKYILDYLSQLKHLLSAGVPAETIREFGINGGYLYLGLTGFFRNLKNRSSIT